jgi:hypothetical protein
MHHTRVKAHDADHVKLLQEQLLMSGVDWRPTRVMNLIRGVWPLPVGRKKRGAA